MFIFLMLLCHLKLANLKPSPQFFAYYQKWNVSLKTQNASFSIMKNVPISNTKMYLFQIRKSVRFKCENPAFSEKRYVSFSNTKNVSFSYNWHTDDIRVYTSDMRMTYEYIRVTHGWNSSIYEWHTNDIWIRVHTSDIRMAVT